MLKSAMWVHGHNFRPQHPSDGHLWAAGSPSTDVIGYDLGWGTTFGLQPIAVPHGTTTEDPTDTWFHVAIPTPVIADGQRLFLDKFFVLFSLGARSGLIGVNAVDAWDGASRIYHAQAPPGFVAYGSGDWTVIRDNQRDWQTSNAYYPRAADGSRHAMQFALGISVLVRAYGNADHAWINFICAGADFHDSAR